MNRLEARLNALPDPVQYLIVVAMVVLLALAGGTGDSWANTF